LQPRKAGCDRVFGTAFGKGVAARLALAKVLDTLVEGVELPVPAMDRAAEARCPLAEGATTPELAKSYSVNRSTI